MENENYHEIVEKIAEKVADMYMEKFPRALSYLTTIISYDSVSDSVMELYHEHTAEELDKLCKYSAEADEQDCTLWDILLEEGEAELMEKLYSPFSISYTDDVEVDLDHPLKFTAFRMLYFDEEGQVSCNRDKGVNLTDEEYKEILVQKLMRHNLYTMNQMVSEKPELYQKIMKLLKSKCINGMESVMPTPFGVDIFELYINEIESGMHVPLAVDMCELRLACESILNPFKDVLNLFTSEDASLKKFAIDHQIVPWCDSVDGIYNGGVDNINIHVRMRFEGRDVIISENQYKGFLDEEDSEFRVGADAIMHKFGLKTPEEIFPYLKEHYNNVDCFPSLREEFSRN